MIFKNARRAGKTPRRWPWLRPPYWPAMKAVRLDIEYHGGGFSGWARQPGLRTVEGELETAVAGVLGGVGTAHCGRPHRRRRSCPRTGGELPDQRRGTCASCRADLNAIGPRDIAVTGAAGAEEGFDARRDAKSRSYSTGCLNRPAPSPFERGRALWWPRRS